jgi:hypothetical protein
LILAEKITFMAKIFRRKEHRDIFKSQIFFLLKKSFELSHL